MWNQTPWEKWRLRNQTPPWGGTRLQWIACDRCGKHDISRGVCFLFKRSSSAFLFSGVPLPYKADEARYRKPPQARYEVINWQEYDKALQQCGSLKV